jgi:hypothetical protein
VSALGKTTSALPKKVGATASLSSTTTASSALPKKTAASAAAAADDDQAEDLTLTAEEAIAQLAAMEVPGWTEAGLPGMDSAKWQEKVDALGVLERRLAELEGTGGGAQFAAALVKYLASTSGGFKISNINILKAVLQTAVAVVKSAG